MSALLRYFCQPWALYEPILRRGVDVMTRHLRGERLPEEQLEAILHAREAREDRKTSHRPEGSRAGSDGYYLAGDSGRIAVVPVEGLICKYSSMINGTSQPEGTTTEAIVQSLTRASQDRQVTGILLDVDSPGGVVSGLPEVVQAVRDAKAHKPVVAFANGMMASAAYWIGSQASAVFASPEAAVGSVGVYTLLEDTSEAWARKGVKFHLVKAGEHKGIGSEGIPVTEEQLGVVRAGVDAVYREFVRSALVEGRKMTTTLAAMMADGRVHVGQEAVTMRLADGVRLFASAVREVEQLVSGGGRSPAAVGPEASSMNTAALPERRDSYGRKVPAPLHGADQVRQEAELAKLHGRGFQGPFLKEVASVMEAQGLSRSAATMRVIETRPDLHSQYAGHGSR